jgi:hypothetical protein
MAGLTPVMLRNVLRVLGESVDARGRLVEAMLMFVVRCKYSENSVALHAGHDEGQHSQAAV